MTPDTTNATAQPPAQVQQPPETPRSAPPPPPPPPQPQIRQQPVPYQPSPYPTQGWTQPAPPVYAPAPGPMYASPAERYDPLVKYRLALAIVSLALLIPLAAIAVGNVLQIGAVASLIALTVICVTVIAVNAIFNSDAMRQNRT
jgi:hypothetical protein